MEINLLRVNIRLVQSMALTVVTLAILGLINQASAFTLNPSSGNYALGSAVTVNIIADAPSRGGDNAVTIDLDIAGGTVVSYTQPSGWLVVQPECNSQASFTTTTKVCVTLAKSGSITDGESLGSFSIQGPSSAASVTVTASALSLYSDGVNADIASSGSKGTLTFSTTGGVQNSSGGGTLPDTAISMDSDTRFIILSVGLALLFLGVVIFSSHYYRKFRYNNMQTRLKNLAEEIEYNSVFIE